MCEVGEDRLGGYDFKAGACNPGHGGCGDDHEDDIEGCWEVRSDDICRGEGGVGDVLQASFFTREQWENDGGFNCGDVGEGWTCATEDPVRIPVVTWTGEEGKFFNKRVPNGVGYPQAYRTQCLTYKGRDYEVDPSCGRCRKSAKPRPDPEPVCDASLETGREGACGPSPGSLGCGSNAKVGVLQTVGNVPDGLVNATNREALERQDRMLLEADPTLMPVKIGGGQSSYGLGYLKLRYSSVLTAGEEVERVEGGFSGNPVYEGDWTDKESYPDGGAFCDGCNRCAWDAWRMCKVKDTEERCVIPFNNQMGGGRRLEGSKIDSVREALKALSGDELEKRKREEVKMLLEEIERDMMRVGGSILH
jgi:hypothetical protein